MNKTCRKIILSSYLFECKGRLQIVHVNTTASSHRPEQLTVAIHESADMQPRDISSHANAVMQSSMSIRFGTKASTCCCSEPKAFPLTVFNWSRNRTGYVLPPLDNHGRQTVTVSQKLIYEAKQPVNITTTQPPCGLSGFLHEKIREVAVMSRVFHTVVCISYWTQTVLFMLFVVYLNHRKGYYILNHLYIFCRTYGQTSCTYACRVMSIWDKWNK